MLKQALASVAVALAVTACGGEADRDSARPSASASSSPDPTVAPIDIAAEFTARMQATQQLQSELSGSIQVGADVPGEISGTLKSVGNDFHQVVTVTRPGSAPRETEVIVVGGTSYTREDAIWVRSPTRPGGDAAVGIEGIIDAAMDDPDRLVLAGTELIDGNRLHRIEIEPAPAISPEMLGIDPAMGDFEAALTFLAEDDGTPAGMGVEATWTQGEPPLAAEMQMRFLFDWGVDDLEVAAPEEAWEMHHSDPLLYRMAYRVGWRATHERATADVLARDIYFSPADAEVQVLRYTDLTVTYDDGEVVTSPSAEQWFEASARVLQSDFGVEPAVANSLFLSNGLEVRLLTLHYDEGGDPTFFQQALIFGDTVAWDANWFSAAGNEVDDGVTLLNMIMSFEPED